MQNPVRGPLPGAGRGPRAVGSQVNAAVQRPFEGVGRWVAEHRLDRMVLGGLAQAIGNTFDAIDNRIRGIRPGLAQAGDALDNIRYRAAEGAAGIVEHVPFVGHGAAEAIRNEFVIAGKSAENLHRKFYKDTRKQTVDDVVAAQLHYNARRAQYDAMARRPTDATNPSELDTFVANNAVEIDTHGRDELAQINSSNTAAIDKKKREIASRLMADKDMRNAVAGNTVMSKDDAKRILEDAYGRNDAKKIFDIVGDRAKAMTPAYGELESRGGKRLTQDDSLSTDDPRLGVRLDIATDIAKRNALDAASKEYGKRIADRILEGQKPENIVAFLVDGNAKRLAEDMRRGLSRPPTREQLERLEEALNNSPFNQKVDIDDRARTPGSHVGKSKRSMDFMWREIIDYRGLHKIDFDSPKDREEFRKTMLLNVYRIDYGNPNRDRSGDMNRVTNEAKKIADKRNPADRVNAINALLGNAALDDNVKFAILFDAAVTGGKDINGTKNIEDILSFVHGKTVDQVMADLSTKLGVSDINVTAPGIRTLVDYVVNLAPDLNLLVEGPDGDLNEAMCKAYFRLQILEDMHRFVRMNADGTNWEFNTDSLGNPYCPENLQPAFKKYMEILQKDRTMGRGFLDAVGAWAIANAGGAMGVTVDQLPDRFFVTPTQAKRETPETLQDLDKDPQLADALKELGLTPAEQARIIEANETSLLNRFLNGSKDAFQKLVRGGALGLLAVAGLTVLSATLGAPIATGVAFVIGGLAVINGLRGGADAIVGFVHSGWELLHGWVTGQDKDRLAEKQNRFKVAVRRLGAFFLGAAGGAATVVVFGPFAGIIASILMVPAEKVAEITRLAEGKSKVKKLMQEIQDGTIAGLSEEEKAARVAEFRAWIEKEDKAKNFWYAVVSGYATGSSLTAMFAPASIKGLGPKAIQNLRQRMAGGPVTPPGGNVVQGQFNQQGGGAQAQGQLNQQGGGGAKVQGQLGGAGGNVQQGTVNVPQRGFNAADVPYIKDLNRVEVQVLPNTGAGVVIEALKKATGMNGGPLIDFMRNELYMAGHGQAIDINVLIDYLMRGNGMTQAQAQAVVARLDQRFIDMILHRPGSGVVPNEVIGIPADPYIINALFDK